MSGFLHAIMSLDRTKDTSARSASDSERGGESTGIQLEGLRRDAEHEPSNAPASSTSDLVAAKRRRMAPRRKMLNSGRSPLLRLPPELMEPIIFYAAADKHVRKWMKLGHICSIMRDVLLGLHCLWADAICSFPGGRNRDELLERADLSAPLWLSVPARGGALDAGQFALDRLDRARVIEASQFEFLERFLHIVDSSCLSYLDEVNFKPERIVALEQPPKATPRLKHVKLVNMLWTFCAPTLVSLTIECHKTKPIYPSSRFIGLLRQNNTLQTLNLKNCLPYISDDFVRESTLIFLVLSLLCVWDKREHALQFWRLVSLVADAKVVLILTCATGRSPPHPDYTGPPSFEDSVLFVRHLEHQRGLMLTVTGGDPASLSLIVSSTLNSDAARTAACSPHDVLQLTYLEAFADGFGLTPRRDRQRDSLHRVCAGLGLFEITRLSRKAQYNYDSPDQWASILNDFTVLEHLNVVSFSKYLCQALHVSSAQTHAPLLPSLRELTVEKTSLQTEDRAQLQFLTVASLFAMLHSRTTQGHPLKILRLLNLRIRPSDKEQARASFVDEYNSQFSSCYLETT